MEQATHEIERAIEDLQREAGIHSKVQDLKDRLERHRKGLQTRADYLQGRVATLEEIKKTYHKPDYSHLIPEGVTHMHGIELAKHSHHLETLARILRGEPDTVEVLGGKLDVPVETVEESEVVEEEPQEFEEDSLLDLLS